MNTETSIQQQPALAAATAQTAETQPVKTRPATRTGKIARLPKATRDKLNAMLDDGIPYLAIIQSLGTEGEGLNETNLSNWKAGGYLEWQRSRQLIEAIHAKYEFAEDIVQRATDHNTPGRALLHVIATNVCRFLADTDPATMNDNLFSDPDKFTRFVNAMVRLAQSSLQKDTNPQASITAGKPGKGISQSSLQAAEEALNLM